MALSPGGSRRIGGTVRFAVDGVVHTVAGHFKYNLGHPKMTSKTGPSGHRGYVEEPQIAFIEGELQDHSGLDLKTLVTQVEGTVTLMLGNGKSIMLHEAHFAATGDVETSEGKITGRFEGSSAEEMQ